MKLIINADDYGWDKDANRAILQLCKEEKLHGVSIMANWVDKSALLQLLAFQPAVRLGVHIVLNEGVPLSDPNQIRSLVNKNGLFRSSYQLWIRYLLGLVKREQIQTEIAAQIAFLRSEGVHLVHADSHQHIHQFPFLGKAILDILRREGIQSVRNSKPYERNDFRRKVLSFFCWLSHGSLKGFGSNDLLVTYLATNSHLKTEDLRKTFLDLEAKSVKEVELMCHPAFSDREGSYLKRKREFEFLQSHCLADYSGEESLFVQSTIPETNMLQ